MPTTARGWITQGAGVVVAGLFIYAAVLKFADLHAFAVSIQHYRVLPDGIVPWLALFVPSCEVAAAAALPFRRTHRGGAVVAGLLLLVFTAAMGQALVRHINIDCGCFGSETPVPVTWKSLARNGALLLLCAVSFMRPQTVTATKA